MSGNEKTLPSGWTRTTLGEITDVSSGYGFPIQYQGRNEGDIPFAKVGDISSAVVNGQPEITTAANFISYDDLRALGGRTVPAGSIVFAKIGEAIRLNRRAITGREMVFDNNVMAATPNPEAVDARFLFHLLRTIDFYELASATTVPSVRKSDVESLSILLPPLPEQRRIVAKLEELSTRSRHTREELDAVAPLLGKFRQSLLAAAFRGDLTADWRSRNPHVEPASVLLERICAERRRQWEAAELAKMRTKGKEPKNDRWKRNHEEPEPVDTSGLPEIPEGWCWASLGQVVLLVSYGLTASAESAPVGPKFLRITDLQNRSVQWETVPYCKGEDFGRYYLKPGDIVVARTGATTGKSHLLQDIPEPAVFASYLIRLETSQAFPPEYVGFFMDSPSYWDQITTVSKGSAQPGANASILSRLVVPLPPREEIGHIVRHVSLAIAPLAALERQAFYAKERLMSFDQSVLVKAFRGELVPQDPDDEPASALLERIRAARDQEGPRRGRGRRPARPAAP